LGITVENVQEIFLEALSTVSDDPDKVLDFASFLKIMGLKGSNDDYWDVELEDHRLRLLEALTTFHTFDEDGGGTIDALEVKATMRAMGQKV
jgi:Ca2+-binding EF-hand superfamily protein